MKRECLFPLDWDQSYVCETHQSGVRKLVEKIPKLTVLFYCAVAIVS